MFGVGERPGGGETGDAAADDGDGGALGAGWVQGSLPVRRLVAAREKRRRLPRVPGMIAACFGAKRERACACHCCGGGGAGDDAAAVHFTFSRKAGEGRQVSSRTSPIPPRTGGRAL